MLRHVALVRTDVSEELSASFIRVTRISELGTTLAVTSKRRLLVTAIKQKWHIIRQNIWMRPTCTVRVVTGLCTRPSAGVSVATDPVCITVVPDTDTTAPICCGDDAWLNPTTTACGAELGTGDCVEEAGEGIDGADTWGTEAADPDFAAAATCCCCKDGAMNVCPPDSTCACKVTDLYSLSLSLTCTRVHRHTKEFP
jgi:hypothetical protein